jgi:hypothetical protein
MSTKKETIRKTTSSKSKMQVVDHAPLFGKSNLLLMLAGAFIIGLGMVLMAGGKNPDPNVFDPKEVYSTTRITIAPVLIVIGLVVEVYAIFRK